MASSTTFVIIGGGLAGAKAVEALRDSGFDGQIVVFAEEQHLPYERPPLSKEYLAGKKALSDFTVHNADWYRDHNVDLRLGSRVSSFCPSAPTAGVCAGAHGRPRPTPCGPRDPRRRAHRFPAPTPTASTICAPTTTPRH